ncbi:hypothetical protein FB446DRAFT_709111 [Lentinula raphanica]|nr:hypothetical protein FB446DRAFT_709111 [Lentinula raphanica]
MSFRRGPSLKARRIAQLSRQVNDLQKELNAKDQELTWRDQQLSLKDQQLNDAETELDELMNSESQRIQALENERRQNYIDKTQAEIKAERYQRRLKHSEIQVEELQRSLTETSCGKSEVELRAEKLQHRVEELEANIKELQRRSMAEKCKSGTEPIPVIPANEVIFTGSGSAEQSKSHTAVSENTPLGIFQSIADSATIPTEAKLLPYVESDLQSTDVRSIPAGIFQTMERGAITTQLEVSISLKPASQLHALIPPSFTQLSPDPEDILQSTFSLSLSQLLPDYDGNIAHSVPFENAQTMERSASSTAQLEILPYNEASSQWIVPRSTMLGNSQIWEHSASTTTQPGPLLYPEDALQSTIARSWFPAAFDYVNVDLGEDFTFTLQSWIQLERMKDWVSSQKGIGCKNRPKELTRWITNGRDELANFGKAFVNWWTSLKQTTSEPKRGGSGRRGNGWGTLNTSRKNGWFSIIVCLKWWGMGLGEHRQQVLGNDWHQSVNELLTQARILLDERLKHEKPSASSISAYRDLLTKFEDTRSSTPTSLQPKIPWSNDLKGNTASQYQSLLAGSSESESSDYDLRVMAAGLSSNRLHDTTRNPSLETSFEKFQAEITKETVRSMLNSASEVNSAEKDSLESLLVPGSDGRLQLGASKRNVKTTRALVTVSSLKDVALDLQHRLRNLSFSQPPADIQLNPLEMLEPPKKLRRFWES